MKIKEFLGVFTTRQKLSILGFIAVVVLLIYGNFAYMTSKGYHLEWSWGNMKTVWVDKDGKTAP